MPYNWSHCNCYDCIGLNTPLEFVEQERISTQPTPWAVYCYAHGRVYLTNHEYNRQMHFANRGWVCPICGDFASFDDDNFDNATDELEEGREE